MDEMIYNSKFIQSFKAADNTTVSPRDGLVYHYTSPEALLNIIQTGTVRFTDTKYLNDKSESIFFVKRLLEFIESEKAAYPKFFKIIKFLIPIEDWDEIINLKTNQLHFNEGTLIPFQPDRTFVFCTSEEPDELSLWNYYVKNNLNQGYNLGINLNKFVKTFDTDSSSYSDYLIVYYGSVLYDEKKQFSEIKNLAEFYERSKIRNTMAIHGAALHLRSYIELQGLFFKSDKFKHEKEYRVVLSISNEFIPRKNNLFNGQNNHEMKEVFFTRNGLLVPALAVVLPKDSISRIYISPMTEFGIAKASVKELLDINEFKNGTQSVGVYKSKIPIRF